eukprot:TRINITY_DN4465_c0_g1_i1.p1 TRINITY_DN4465_c0_g1~~TRINITY_DN4465_c0_g1_i1.p1  ORF type:complete len:775 (-),score=126.10 TRINITY_DN4465_c0_g1_i1:51-2045(-)
MRVTVLNNSSTLVSVLISDIADNAPQPFVLSNWTLTLSANDRFFRMQTTSRSVRAFNCVGVRVSSYLGTLSTHGFFLRGVVQIMNAPNQYFASTDPVHRIYTLGGGIVQSGISADFNFTTAPAEVVLLNGNASNPFYRSGVQFVLVGSYPGAKDSWDSLGWSHASLAVPVPEGSSWSTDGFVGVNDHDFPVLNIPQNTNLRPMDMMGFYLGIYASSSAALVSYILPSHISPTLATPNHAYSPLYNFYDPDTYLSVACLVYSGDAYLLNEARKLVELSGTGILSSGQIPHHYDNDTPIYVAISGATQTGPNLFWSAAAMLYAHTSGNTTWLKEMLPTVEKAMDFVINLYDPNMKLIKAPGPLWIDVFKRANYTTDTNAFCVHVLTELAAVEALFGNQNKQQQYLQLASSISEGINAHLWRGDHYITQLNPDGTFKDLVDYDSNLLVTAFNIAPANRTTALLKRVDGGKCTHARATYVSEIFYDAANCYLNNTGDSAVTMGRIGWVDALTRKNINDITMFNEVLYTPILKDLITYTWLYERYTCQGTMTHNNYYIEYPEYIVIVQREVMYGIQVRLDRVTVDPLEDRPFRYITGDIDITYSPTEVRVVVPPVGLPRRLHIGNLVPSSPYKIISHDDGIVVHTDEQGHLEVDSLWLDGDGGVHLMAV